MVLNSNWQYIHTFYCIQENCSQYAEFCFDLLFEVHKDQYRIRRHNGDFCRTKNTLGKELRSNWLVKLPLH